MSKLSISEAQRRRRFRPIEENPSAHHPVAVIRVRRKLTQRQLAEIAGICTNTVSTVERRAVWPSLDTLDKLAKALGVNVDSLVSAHE
jgi:DNA-binding XRE family transcriptional regulator